MLTYYRCRDGHIDRAEFDGESPKEAADALHWVDLVEAAASYQDMMQGSMDAYLSAISNRLNETMKRLTVIGAIMAAMTVITGVYGMNFENMPELHWRYGYLFVWFVMAVVTPGLWLWFRKKRWI